MSCDHSRLETRRAEEKSRKELEKTMARFEAEKNKKEEQKLKLENDNRVLKDHMTSILEMIKQEECYIQNLKQKELLLQKSVEDIMGFMSICDWTLQHDLSRSSSYLTRKAQSNSERFD